MNSGEVALWSALAFSMAAVLSLLRRPARPDLTRGLLLAALAFASLSTLVLGSALLSADFSLAWVAARSSIELGPLARLVGFLGAPAGLALLAAPLVTALIAVDRGTHSLELAAGSCLVLIVIAVTGDPFASTSFVPLDGAGLPVELRTWPTVAGRALLPVAAASAVAGSRFAGDRVPRYTAALAGAAIVASALLQLEGAVRSGQYRSATLTGFEGGVGAGLALVAAIAATAATGTGGPRFDSRALMALLATVAAAMLTTGASVPAAAPFLLLAFGLVLALSSLRTSGRTGARWLLAALACAAVAALTETRARDGELSVAPGMTVIDTATRLGVTHQGISRFEGPGWHVASVALATNGAAIFAPEIREYVDARDRTQRDLALRPATSTGVRGRALFWLERVEENDRAALTTRFIPFNWLWFTAALLLIVGLGLRSRPGAG
ncbi:MAG: hypothetical protein ACT4OZ_14040 [Gemmatimonadota bacterium]